MEYVPCDVQWTRCEWRDDGCERWFWCDDDDGVFSVGWVADALMTRCDAAAARARVLM